MRLFTLLAVLALCGCAARALPPLFSATSPDEARSLIAAGADVNERAPDRTTPLLAAARSGRDGVTHALIKAGANVNQQQRNGWTALHEAAATGNVATVKVLLEAGAIVDLRDQLGCTPLYVANVSGNADVAQVLLSAGANPDARDLRGRTARQIGLLYRAQTEKVQVTSTAEK